MRVQFNPQSNEFWRAHYAQRGGNPFQGYAFQRGAGIGSIFKGLLRVILPVAKSAGRTVGKQALKSGAAIMSDVLDGRDIGEAAVAHGKRGVGMLARNAVRKVTGKKKKKRRRRQTGGGLGQRKTQKSINKRGIPKKKTRKTAKRRQKKQDALGTYLA